MPQSHTSSKPHVSGQLPGSGAVSSEDPFFTDEAAGREFYIPFAPFAHAFLQAGADDAAIASTHKDSLEFRTAYDLFSDALSAALTELDQICSPLAALINHVLDTELARQPTPGALPLRFDDVSSGVGI
jgi:hypothetical protein